jgi:hypothetical protein
MGDVVVTMLTYRTFSLHGAWRATPAIATPHVSLPHYPPSRMSTLQAGMCRDVPPAGADRLHVSLAGACALACGVPERLGLLRPRDRPQRVLDGEPGNLSPQREAVGRGAPEVHAGVHPRVGVFLPRL